MIRNLTASVDSCRDSLNMRVDAMERNIKAEIRNEMKQLQDYVDLNIAQIVNRVEALEGKVEALQQQQERPDYDPEVTVVARGLVYEQDEDVHEKASTMLRRGLGLRDIPIVRAMRMTGYGNRPGIVKIQLSSLDDKKKVLRAKAELKNSGDFSNVYLRTAYTHAERLMDLNFRAILRKLPGGQNMRLTGHGRIIERDNLRQGNDGQHNERRENVNRN